MYIKMESMRLDWYSNPKHQKIIRAELYQVRKIYLLFGFFLADDSYYFTDITHRS